MTQHSRLPETCHCCEGVRSLTPQAHPNPPGLPVLAYRVGTHSSFKSSMQSRIAGKPSLSNLGARDDDDLTIAIIDTWATIADITSFYTQLIANESFIRTSTELRSTQELASSIGYAPHPGVAAGTYLAFTVEDSPGAAKDVPIPAGTPAQSSPEGDETPQTFETLRDLQAHPEWNALRPRLTEPQTFNAGSRVFYLQTTNAELTTGDWVLLRAADTANSNSATNVLLKVAAVEPNQELGYTRIQLIDPKGPTASPVGPPKIGFAGSPPPPPPGVFLADLKLTAGAVTDLADYGWSAEDLDLFEKQHFMQNGILTDLVNDLDTTPAPTDTGVHALRVQTAPFGHNAPRWQTIPFDWRSPPIGNAPYQAAWDEDEPPPPGTDFLWPVNSGSHRGKRTTYRDIYGSAKEMLLLDAEFPEILPGSWVVLRSSGTDGRVASYRVDTAQKISRADFAISGQVTSLTVIPVNGDPRIDEFGLRTTTIHAQSEELPLADRPVETPVQGSLIELETALESRLYRGHRIVVTGTPTGFTETVVSEIATVAEAKDVAGHTRLQLESELQNSYRRDSVRINANLVEASHGETQREVLGGGDASKQYQSFTLSRPLTYVSAPVPGGAKSTLQLRVDGILWDERPHFFRAGPEERSYVLHRDDRGHTTVAFGDGTSGKRPFSGFDNLTTTYRTGLGAAGNLPANRITLLGAQPRWVQRVTNPLPATGGADPESAHNIKRNAPDSLITFGRIVALADFARFARAFAGISKAQADLVRLDEGDVVHLTVAGENGAQVLSESALYRDLVDQINKVRDPVHRLRVASFQRLFFDVKARVRVFPNHQADVVMEKVEKVLRQTFSFDRRELGQGVTTSEVLAAIHRVGGVEAADLDTFRYSHQKSGSLKMIGLPGPKLVGSPSSRKRFVPALRALPARLSAGGPLPAQHLSIHLVDLTAM